MNESNTRASLLGAIGIAFLGMIAGIALSIAGVETPRPVFVFVGALGISGVWLGVTLASDLAHSHGEERRMNDANATRIKIETRAKLMLARAECERLQLQAANVARSGDIKELPAASIDETKLMSRAYTSDRRIVSIPLWRLKRLIEIYPLVTRAAIKTAGITNGDQDCNDLMTVAEMEGWVARQGKGKEAQWVISPLHARRAYMILVEDALARAKNGSHNFDAPTDTNALMISAQPVYETGRQTGRQV